MANWTIGMARHSNQDGLDHNQGIQQRIVRDCSDASDQPQQPNRAMECCRLRIVSLRRLLPISVHLALLPAGVMQRICVQRRHPGAGVISSHRALGNGGTSLITRVMAPDG